MAEITKEYVRSVFDYRDGVLYWKISPRFNVKIGDASNSLSKKGYRQSRLNGKLYYSHRLIFLWHHGYLPDFVDHIDGNPLNNKIKNLREATLSQNNWNAKIPMHNTSGVKGVCWDKNRNKWHVKIKKFGKTINIGRFTDINDAINAITSARKEYHGSFFNDGVKNA